MSDCPEWQRVTTIPNDQMMTPHSLIDRSDCAVYPRYTSLWCGQLVLAIVLVFVVSVSQHKRFRFIVFTKNSFCHQTTKNCTV